MAKKHDSMAQAVYDRLKGQVGGPVDEQVDYMVDWAYKQGWTNMFSVDDTKVLRGLIETLVKGGSINVTPQVAPVIAPQIVGDDGDDDDDALPQPAARTDISDDELEDLVEAKVEEMIGKGDSFTAWNVTKALRADNPNLEIEHYRVRSMVHSSPELNGALAVADYIRYPDGNIPGTPFRYTATVVAQADDD